MDDFHALVRKAINGQSMLDFAKKANMSRSNLSMMMSNDYDRKPNIQTLKKIADASEGIVSVDELEDSIVNNTLSKSNKFDDSLRNREFDMKEKIWEMAEKEKENLMHLKGSRFRSMEDFLDVIMLTQPLGVDEYSVQMVDSCGDYTSFGRYGAEKYTGAMIEWIDNIWSVKMYFNIYYCNTENGGVVVQDLAFDLPSLVSEKCQHERAYDFAFRMGSLGDLEYTDYPMVLDVKRSESVMQKRLLQAIFGEDEPDEELAASSEKNDLEENK